MNTRDLRVGQMVRLAARPEIRGTVQSYTSQVVTFLVRSPQGGMIEMERFADELITGPERTQWLVTIDDSAGIGVIADTVQAALRTAWAKYDVEFYTIPFTPDVEEEA